MPILSDMSDKPKYGCLSEKLGVTYKRYISVTVIEDKFEHAAISKSNRVWYAGLLNKVPSYDVYMWLCTLISFNLLT